ncbi:hypothetical protein [Photobacterium galatheae]|uniref:Uncharacterized protein n=1 Tax=Photobacterium galatheae TaxID=1654360 RepID=A0A066RKM3_9GAMM|nr:hypothetical protein [Photobacterium galatheae]KDM89646.1 hypothetical protein EA58_21455 [Photobacterium galatheae]MCM0149790.1 hypothetical protein [Photobacterium galatheae]
MHTDICFTNLSLNIHRPSVTIFQRTQVETSENLIAWKVIQHCPYRWHHPFCIEWEYSYQLADHDGNYSAVTPLPPRHRSETENQGLRISYAADQVVFTKTAASKYAEVVLLKNGRMIARQPFFPPAQTTFRLSETYYLCADLRVEEGAVIHSHNINASLTPFRVTGQERLNIIMTGGQPGIESTPICFQFS